jgi:putative membrane protein
VRFLTWLLTTAIAIATATWLFEDIFFEGATTWPQELEDKIIPLILVSLIFGIVTWIVKPIVTILSIPFILLTLGLFLLVINAGMLLLVGWLSEQFDIPFHVEGFWTAVGGAIVITLMTWVVGALIGSD